MKIIYDPEVDALSIQFGETTVTTQELAEGIAAEYDEQGRVTSVDYALAELLARAEVPR